MSTDPIVPPESALRARLLNLNPRLPHERAANARSLMWSRVRGAEVEARGLLLTPAVDWRGPSVAAEILACAPEPDTVEVLARVLGGDARPAVRSAAASALRRLDDWEAVPALIDAAGDPDWMVRLEVARALGALGDPRARPALTRLTQDPDECVCPEAAEALTQLTTAGGRNPAALAQGLHDRLSTVAGEIEIAFSDTRNVLEGMTVTEELPNRLIRGRLAATMRRADTLKANAARWFEGSADADDVQLVPWATSSHSYYGGDEDRERVSHAKWRWELAAAECVRIQDAIWNEGHTRNRRLGRHPRDPSHTLREAVLIVDAFAEALSMITTDREGS